MMLARTWPLVLALISLMFLPALAEDPPEGGFDLLLDTPGTSSSLAAGYYNPAALALESGGTFVSWDDHLLYSDAPSLRNWAGMLDMGNLGFGWRSFEFEDADGAKTSYNDYQLGLAGGNPGNAWGMSYAWSSDEDAHEYLRTGSIMRWRHLSLGMVDIWDMTDDLHTLQADLGLRPFGPRLTLFGEASYPLQEEEAELQTAFGLKADLLAGLSVLGKVRDDKTFSFGINLGLAGSSPSIRSHHGTEARFGTSYAIEFREDGPQLAFSRKGDAYPEVNLKGGMAYRRYRYFDKGRTFFSTLGRINRYAEDPKVKGVVVNISGMYMQPEIALELRDQLAGLRKSGRKVIVYADRVNLFSLMLASVADQLWLDPEGGLDIRGISFGGTYMRDALDKAGVGVDELRFFTYKSAMESLSRTGPSDASIEQNQAIVDDFYETCVGHIVASRGIEREVWDELVGEKGELMASEALAAGLVDYLGGWHDAKEAAKDAPLRETPDLTATALAGLRGDPVWRDSQWGERDRIAVLYAIGPCAMDSGIEGRRLSEKIRKAREDKRVKAIVLRADSPGGDPLPSDLVSRELKKTMEKKPVIVSQGQVAGSGGYWISMHSNSILASPLTITGSIGVIGAHFYDGGLSEKIGLRFAGVKRGEHSDLYDGINIPFIGSLPAKPMTEEQRARAEYTICALYDDFVSQVAEGRGMSTEEVDAVGQGRIWSGIDGKDVGLVDEIGGLWDALQLAKSEAGIDADQPVVITEGPHRGKFNPNVLAPKLLGIDLKTVERATNPATRYFSEQELFYLESLRAGSPVLLMEPVQIIDGDQVH